MAKTIAFVVLLLAALVSVQSTTVEQVALAGGCATSAVKGLSEQLIDEMNCLHSGLFKSIAGHSKISIGSSAFPYLQTKAADALFRVVSSGSSTLSVNSALRTLPQQYLLYRWKNLGLCGITAAAAPGRSNHNGGLAVDVNSYSSWITPMSKQSWDWFGDGDKVHFDYTGSGTQDVRSLSTLAFQKLWNANNPNDKIAEDGDYGPATEKRLQKSPASGFSKGSTCSKNYEPVHYENKRRQDEICTVVGPKNGTCIDVTSCLGTPYGGYCPGPNNIQCCVPGAQGGARQTTNTNGVNLIKSFEGFYPNFYYDSVGIKTIGYGHACHVNDCSDLQAKSSTGVWREVFAPLSETDASDLLRGDLEKGGYEDCVRGALTRSVSDDAFSSLVSFVFNVGCSGFSSSTLKKRVNANAPLEGTGGVREAFLMWNKAGGEVLAGLTRRRNAEADLYGSVTTNQDIPPSSNSQYEGKDCWYSSKKGVCLDSAKCTGTTHSGLCSGPSNIKCCIGNKCTISTSNDGVCIQTSSCTSTPVSGKCMGASDIKCCKSTKKRQEASVTVPCPDGAVFNTTSRFCEDTDYVYGPFPEAMVQQCKQNHGGSQCDKLYTVTVNGYSIRIPKWKKSVAWEARGESDCPFGTVLDQNFLGECTEYVSDGSNDTFTSISIFGGLIDTTVADACFAQGGGVACYSTKWSAKFYVALVNPGLDQNLDFENATTTDSDDFFEVGNWWLEEQVKYSEDLTQSAASTLSAALALFAAVFVMMA